jgi:chemotaxis signal transduction protein
MNEKGGRIDWEDVKRRLQASQQALLATEENVETVYQERAAALARRGAQTDVATTALRVLVFALGTERYALEFAHLVELLPFTSCTPVPAGPPELLGVVNVHGEIRSVVDLGRLLDLPGRDKNAGGYVLLLRQQERQIVLRVDHIDKILLLAPEDLAVAGDGVAGHALHYLMALGPDRLRLLNLKALFAHPVFGGARARS